MKLSLVIGRFQPCHNGHLTLIDEARKQGEKTLVLIGSAGKLPDFKNPFSADERLNLLKQVNPEGDDIIYRTLRDKPTDDEWVQDVVAQVLSLEEDPTQVTLFCAPKDEQWYRSNLLYPVETVAEDNISATQIRTAWYGNSLWAVEDKIPEATLSLLNNHKDLDRLSTEYSVVSRDHLNKVDSHPFNNPIEPVSFAVIIQDNKLLTGVRGNPRGDGQLGLPGGYINSTESTMDGCMREVNEELSIDLHELIVQGKAKCIARSIEENLDDLGARTLGINYLFVVDPSVTLDIEVDNVETTGYQWLPLSEVLTEDIPLFYNHNLVTQRLISQLGELKK